MSNGYVISLLEDIHVAPEVHTEPTATKHKLKRQNTLENQ